jgi:hypothetical protein
MKWLTILVVAATIVVALAKVGFIDDFLGPWSAWANYIGYFQ